MLQGILAGLAKSGLTLVVQKALCLAQVAGAAVKPDEFLGGRELAQAGDQQIHFLPIPEAVLSEPEGVGKPSGDGLHGRRPGGKRR